MQIGVIGFDTKSYCIMHYLCHVNIRLYKRIFRCLYYTEIEHGGVAVKCNTCIPKKVVPYLYLDIENTDWAIKLLLCFPSIFPRESRAATSKETSF
jgi:hypothetical protein